MEVITRTKRVSASGNKIISADGHDIEISNPGKLLFPENKTRKEDLVSYYARISPYLLPHLEDRPLSMQRFPNGIHRPGFYQKEAGSHFPEWIDTVEVPKEDGVNNQVVVNTGAALIYLANQGNITFHTWLSRADRLRHPDKIVFDLDPTREGEYDKIVKTANCFHDLLHELGFVPYVMTSGSKGLHVVVPIKREFEFDVVKSFATSVAELLQKKWPGQLTMQIRKQKRRGRIFLDVLRNSYAQTSVAPYTLRAGTSAAIATPLYWEELSKTGMNPQRFNINNIFRRLGRIEDPWKDIYNNARPVSKAQAKLKELQEKYSAL